MPKLENWSVVSSDSNPFLAPELRSVCLQGVISDDGVRGKFVDGRRILTSPVVKFNFEEKFAQTLNTHYELGTINPIYEQFLKDNNIELKSSKCEVEDVL